MARGLLPALVTVAIVVSTAGWVPAATSQPADTLPAADGTAYRGDLHAHTAFSDGDGRPGEAFEAARSAGLDFFAVTDHGEWLAFPWAAHSECIDPTTSRFLAKSCFEPNSSMPDQLEWERTGDAADAATDQGFVGLRGFEWSSPVEGHVNVFGTDLWTDSVQTGPAPMEPFYGWLAGQTQDPRRVASFNHPGREPLRFDAFTHVPAADARFGTIEAFNRHGNYTDDVLDALDAGWRVGAIGVTDAHGPGAWTDLSKGHTVVVADALTRDAILDALLEHRTVATLGTQIDARLTVSHGSEEATIGETLSVPSGGSVGFSIEVKDFGGRAIEKVELLGPQGFHRTFSGGTAHMNPGGFIDLSQIPTTATGERYLTVRGFQGGTPTVMTSPVWITTPS